MKDDDDEKTAIEKEITTITEHRDDLESQLEGIDAELRNAQTRDAGDSGLSDRGDADGNTVPEQDASHGQDESGASVASLEGKRGVVQEGIDRDNKTLASLEKARDGEGGDIQSTGTYETTAQFGARGPSGEIKEYSASIDNDPSAPPPGGGGPDGGSAGGNGSDPSGTPRTGKPTEEWLQAQQLIQASNNVWDTKNAEVQHLGKEVMQMTPQQDAAFGIGNLPQDPASTILFAAAATAAVIEDKGQLVVDAVKGLDQRSEQRVEQALQDQNPSEQNVRENAMLDQIHAEDVSKEQAARDEREAKSAEAPAKAPDAPQESQSDVMAAAERDDAAKHAQAKESKAQDKTDDVQDKTDHPQDKTESPPSIGGPEDSKFLSSLKADTVAPIPEPGVSESKFLSEMRQGNSGEVPAPSEPSIENSNGQEPPPVPTPSEPAVPQASRNGDGDAAPSFPPEEQSASQIAANDNHPPPANDNERDDR